jgi:osmotically-inducible protein OsmY
MQNQTGFTHDTPTSWKHADALMREAICRRLEMYDRKLAGNIEVEVANGIVTLQGASDTPDCRRLAEDVAQAALRILDLQAQIGTS